MTSATYYDPTPVAHARALSPKPYLPGVWFDQAAAGPNVPPPPPSPIGTLGARKLN